MTLDEAIEILQVNSFKAITPAGMDFNDALKLGTAALKRLEEWRAGTVLNPDLLLPGETE